MNRAAIVSKLRKILQINQAPIVLPGQSKGKSLSTNLLVRAVCGSKAIYNKHYSNVVEESYKVMLVVDCSGSRTHHLCGSGIEMWRDVAQQIIRLYYYLIESIGRDNVQCYLFNCLTVDAMEVLGRRCFSFANEHEFLRDNQWEDIYQRIYDWTETKVKAAGGRACGTADISCGNHDGYSLRVVSSVPFWGSVPKGKRLIIHVSDGQPSCDYTDCGLPGCFDERTKLRADYDEVVKKLIGDGWLLCGVGVDRSLATWYGEDNCIQTSENPNEMMQKFVDFFRQKVKVKRVNI